MEMTGEMDKQVDKLMKVSLGHHYMDEIPAAAKPKLHAFEMDTPCVLGKLVFCRPPLRWRPRL